MKLRLFAMILLGGLIWNPAMMAGPVGAPGSFPFSTMNAAGDFVLTGNYKTYVRWDGRFASAHLPMTGDEQDFYSSGIASRQLAQTNRVAIACSGQRAALFDATRDSRHPGGSWNVYYKSPTDASEHGMLRCAMRPDGQFAIWDLGRSVMMLSNQAEPIKMPNLGQHVWLAATAEYFVIMGKGKIYWMNPSGILQESGITLPPLDEYSRIGAGGHRLVYTDSYRILHTTLQNHLREGDFPQPPKMADLDVKPCGDKQACAISVADDDSFMIAGAWGTYIHTAGVTTRVAMKMFAGETGAAALGHSGKNGQFIFAGRDDGDFGWLSELTVALTEEGDELSITAPWFRWKLPVLPGISHRSFYRPGELLTPWWATRIGRDDAWRLAGEAGMTSAPVVIAQVDSGTTATHPILGKAAYQNPGEIADNGEDDEDNGYVDDVPGYDFVMDDNDPADLMGHGTHVSGLLASRDADGIPFATARNGSLMAVRAIDQSGKSNSIELSRAIDYAVGQGAEVMNCSWGGGAESVALRSAVKRALAAGLIIVASAGNDALDTDGGSHFPGTYPGVLAVGAITEHDKLASFSSYGARTVAFLAPGEGILSSLRDGQLGMMSGTSMASPMVASAAAWLSGLVKAKYPQWDIYQRRDKVIQILCDSADKRQDLSRRSRCGIIRVDKATKMLLDQR